MRLNYCYVNTSHFNNPVRANGKSISIGLGGECIKRELRCTYVAPNFEFLSMHFPSRSTLLPKPGLQRGMRGRLRRGGRTAPRCTFANRTSSTRWWLSDLSRGSASSRSNDDRQVISRNVVSLMRIFVAMRWPFHGIKMQSPDLK